MRAFEAETKSLKAADRRNLSHLEPAVFAENGHFHVVFGHLALKSLFQRENGDVNGILKLNILAVPLTRSEARRGRAGRARGLI